MSKLEVQSSMEKTLPFPLGHVPKEVRPYLELIRFQKPTGTIIMFWPFAWGLTMAAYRTNLDLNTYWMEIARLLVAAFIVRSSACTINDIFDRKFDAGVERSKNRPLASGRVSVFGAVAFLVAQYLVAVLFYFSYQGIAFYTAITQLLPVFIVYPLMKRVTYWPQAWLGVGLSFGLPISWASVTGNLDETELIGIMMFGIWAWCMHIDTIYACQDRRDDVKVGVKSTAVMLGDYVRPFTSVCAAMFAGALWYAGSLNGQSDIFTYIGVGGTVAHLVYQYAIVDLDVPSSCWQNFLSNGHLGLIPWIGLLLDYLHKIDRLPFELPFGLTA